MTSLEDLSTKEEKRLESDERKDRRRNGRKDEHFEGRFREATQIQDVRSDSERAVLTRRKRRV